MKNNSGKNNLVTKQYLNKVLTDYPTKKDLNNALKDVVRKKDLKLMGNRLVKKLNQVVDFFDDEVQPLKNRVDRIENHLQLPQLSS